MGLLNIFGRNVNLDTLSLINKADEEIKRNNLQASIETLSKVIEIMFTLKEENLFNY